MCVYMLLCSSYLHSVDFTAQSRFFRPLYHRRMKLFPCERRREANKKGALSHEIVNMFNTNQIFARIATDGVIFFFSI